MVVLILPYGCTILMLTKRTEKKIDCKCKRMLRTVLNKFWRQHPRKEQLCGLLPPISKIILIRRTRHLGHCWRNTDELIRDVFKWNSSHGWAMVWWAAKIYLLQLCTDTWCSIEDQLEAMDDWDEWRERVREICRTRWWWWWWWWWSITCR